MKTYLWKINKEKPKMEEIKNLEALVNPDSLRQFKNIKELNE